MGMGHKNDRIGELNSFWLYKLLVSWFQRRFLKVFPHFKSIEAYDSMASIDTRSVDDRNYVGDHKT